MPVRENPPRSRGPRGLRRVLALGLVSLAAACGFDLDPPEEATLRLEGAGPVRMITSTRFIAKDEPGEDGIGVSFLQSDTTVTTPPYSATRLLDRDDARLFVFVAPAPGYTSGDVRLTVHIEGEEWYDVARDVAERPHHFTFFR